MEGTKKIKSISSKSVRVLIYEGSPVERVCFSLEWKSECVIDGNTGDRQCDDVKYSRWIEVDQNGNRIWLAKWNCKLNGCINYNT